METNADGICTILLLVVRMQDYYAVSLGICTGEGGLNDGVALPPCR